MLFSALEKRLKKRPEVDAERVKRAYLFAEEIHKNQYRKSGELYISHPIAVAISVCDAGLEEDSICAALLHDTLEDGDSPDEIDTFILKSFGQNVHFLVHALSKNPRIADKDEQQQDYLQRFQEAAGMDPDVVFIKLADLLHNLTSLQFLSPKSQEKWAYELQYEYCPLFAKCFQYIPSPYKDEYCEMNDVLHNFIEKYHQNTFHAHDKEYLYAVA